MGISWHHRTTSKITDLPCLVGRQTTVSCPRSMLSTAATCCSDRTVLLISSAIEKTLSAPTSPRTSHFAGPHKIHTQRLITLYEYYCLNFSAVAFHWSKVTCKVWTIRYVCCTLPLVPPAFTRNSLAGQTIASLVKKFPHIRTNGYSQYRRANRTPLGIVNNVMTLFDVDFAQVR